MGIACEPSGKDQTAAVLYRCDSESRLRWELGNIPRRFKVSPVTLLTRFFLVLLATATILNKKTQKSFLRGTPRVPFLTLRFASLYFIISIDKDENELMALEFIQHYVEVLDQYYGNVCLLCPLHHRSVNSILSSTTTR